MKFQEATTIPAGQRMDVHECEPSVDKEEAVRLSRLIGCPPGKVVVACHRRRTKVGVIELPDDVADWAKADLATVIAVGPWSEETHGLKNVTLEPGDVVATDYGLGKRVSGLEAPGIDLDAEVRCYGSGGGEAFDSDLYDGDASGDSSTPFSNEDWSDGVPCKVQGCSVSALGDKVVFRLPPLMDETAGGIVLPDSKKFRSALWTVDSVGPRTEWVKPGMRCCVHTGGAAYLVTENGVEFAVAPERAVYFWV